ncbi:MAG: hypothetical protein KAG28_10090 [Cocleimonas sp.]|nr:hypothetical protein [Cocleimonas sp.]
MKLISSKILARTLLVAALSIGATSTSFAVDDAKAALAAAKVETNAAKKAGFAWTKWGKMFDKAEAALTDGKEKKALKIAANLKKQGLAAQKQAEAAKKAGPRF